MEKCPGSQQLERRLWQSEVQVFQKCGRQLQRKTRRLESGLDPWVCWFLYSMWTGEWGWRCTYCFLLSQVDICRLASMDQGGWTPWGLHTLAPCVQAAPLFEPLKREKRPFPIETPLKLEYYFALDHQINEAHTWETYPHREDGRPCSCVSLHSFCAPLRSVW